MSKRWELEPAKKRRKIGEPVARVPAKFTKLPPDVIVHQIMPYVQAYSATSVWYKETQETMRFMGRFKGDPMRILWMWHVNVFLSDVDILGAVVKARQAAEDGEDVNNAISEFLPAVKHVHIRRYMTRFRPTRVSKYGPVADRLLHYHNEYTEIMETIDSSCYVNLREEFPRGWPELYQDEFAIHLRRVVKVLFAPQMPGLRVINGDMWLLKVWAGVPRLQNSNIDTLNFHESEQITFNELTSMQDDRITKIISPIIWSGTDEGVRKNFFDLLTLYRNLTCLDIGAWFTFYGLEAFGKGFETLLNSRAPFTDLRLPYTFKVDTRFLGWTKRVVTSLKMSATGIGKVPEISDTLKTLNLRNFNIPSAYNLPENVTFINCTFELGPGFVPADICHIKLSGRVRRATFSERCYMFNKPTIHSNTITTLLFHGDMMGFEKLTLVMPNLIRATLIMPARASIVTIISDNALEFLSIERIRSFNVKSYYLQNGVTVLKLVNDFPNFYGALHLIEELYIEKPPQLKNLVNRQGYDKMTNIQVLHVANPRKHDRDDYKTAFNAEKVVFE